MFLLLFLDIFEYFLNSCIPNFYKFSSLFINMNAQEKYELITRNLQEVIGEEDLKEILQTRDLKIYIGNAPTGAPHLGYLVWIFKVADYLKAGCEVKILLADIHAYLDNMKSSFELLEHRTNWYEFIIKELLTYVGVDISKLTFIKGSEYQLSEKYTLDMYKIAVSSTIKSLQHAGAEVVKQTDNPKVGGLLYPVLQALDEEYLDVDAQFGGIDQRKIFMFARENLPKLGYKKRIHLMTPLVPGLGESGKMSASEPNSKIDFHDTNKVIQKKISKAYSKDGEVEGNGLLAMLKYMLFHYFEYKEIPFTINRPEQYGGVISFNSYEEVEQAFESQELSSIDLKMGVTQALQEFITPIREKVEANQELFDKAYN